MKHAKHKQHLFMKCSLQVHKNLNEMKRAGGKKKSLSNFFSPALPPRACNKNVFIPNDAELRMRASNKIKQIKIQIAIHTRTHIGCIE